MIDAKKSNKPMNNNKSNNGGGESSKINLFINRTPGIAVLRTKFLTVLDSSNELLNGISNRLTLSNSSSDTDYLNDDEEDLPKYDETIDYTKIDFEFRRVKARRAHEEIISGRFRYPNLGERFRNDSVQTRQKLKCASNSASTSQSSNSSTSSSSLCDPPKAETAADAQSLKSSTTRSNSIESRHSGGYDRRGRAIPGARRSEVDAQKDMQKRSENLDIQQGSNALHVTHSEQVPDNIATVSVLETPNKCTLAVLPGPTAQSKISNSSTLTSLRDESDLHASLSAESTDWKNFIRSESENSMPSWASSISLDCRVGDETIKDFMQKFIETLYAKPGCIDANLKAEFGTLIRLQIGRQWFIRFIIERKVISKRIEELTFHALVQYFSILLFECAEFEDFTHATVIMNLCFLFYREVDVPGCEPYREYLYLFMRQQPIWHTLKFWNSAFLEAIKGENERRLKKANAKLGKKPTHSDEAMAVTGQPEQQLTTSSSMQTLQTVERAGAAGTNEYTHLKEDIIFRILGMFICNMHALGLPQDLCFEFVRRHATTLHMSKDIMKILKENIQRMYHETELWGAKEI